MKRYFLFCALAFFLFNLKNEAQVLPASFQYSWQDAGLLQEFSNTPITLNILDFGADSSGVLASDLALSNALNTVVNTMKTIYFPEGNYLFENTIVLKSNTIIKGAGADKTNFIFSLGGTDKHCISIEGSQTNNISTLSSFAVKGDSTLVISNPDSFLIGDYLKINFNDSDWVTDDWALGTVGQILKIVGKNRNHLSLNSSLRLGYALAAQPKIRKLKMVSNVGIECLKMVRTDSSIDQTHNIFFRFAENCYVRGVSSKKSNFAHVALDNSTHIEVSGCYFSDAFGFGEGGKAAGVFLTNTSNENLIQNNVFDHLRHSLLLQSGSNANVMGYNYSINAYWQQAPLPTNAAGDLVLHGNYPYANLFEGNICQNIVIDNAHGKNGLHNVFFRNRAALYGIIMNNNPASDSLAFVGNEIVNPNYPYGNYILFGQAHFQYGNNINNNINPLGTNNLNDTSYYLQIKPAFLDGYTWPALGIPNVLNSGTIPAKERMQAQVFTTCGGNLPNAPVGVNEESVSDKNIFIFPNPSSGTLYFQNELIEEQFLKVQVLNTLGKVVFDKIIDIRLGLKLENLPNGLYLLRLKTSKGKIVLLKFVLNK